MPNLKKLFLHIFGELYRPIQYRNAYFFDTNLFLLPPTARPKFIFKSNRSRSITESVREELLSKMGDETVRKTIDSRYNTIRFDDLYAKDSSICPVYYFYILSMNNPANIGSLDFDEAMYQSRIIKGIGVSVEESKLYEEMKRRSPVGHRLDPSGRPKAEFYKWLEEMHSRTTKKAKKAFRHKHPAYLQDIRSLALILFYTLTTKQNVIYYTADIDPITLFLQWLDSMSMRFTLLVMILPQLDNRGKQEVMNGKTLELFIDYDEFVEKRIKIFREWSSSRWETGFHFKIRYWNRQKREFQEIISVTFTEEIANHLSNLHGGLTCHFTKNDTLGNWLHLQYHWPPRDLNETRIRVEVAKQAIINHHPASAAPELHNDMCRYRKQDQRGEISSWSQFT